MSVPLVALILPSYYESNNVNREQIRGSTCSIVASDNHKMSTTPKTTKLSLQRQNYRFLLSNKTNRQQSRLIIHSHKKLKVIEGRKYLIVNDLTWLII